MSDKLKVMVCVPHMGNFPHDFFMSFMAMALRAKEYEDVFVDSFFIGSTLIYEAREKCVAHSLEEKADYILFLDSDMVFPEDIIEKFMKYHGHLDIVSGLYFRRFAPYKPVFYKNWQQELGIEDFAFREAEAWGEGLIEVDGVGGGCLFINTKVFKDMKKPFFFPMMNPSGDTGLGEDLAFSVRVKEAGYKMYVDTTLKFGHVATDVVTEGAFLSYREYLLASGGGDE